MEKLKVKITRVEYHDDLTIGNIYDVIHFDKEDEVTPYKIMDDFGDEVWVEASQCELIKEWQPEKGDMVEVSNDGKQWCSYEYVATYKKLFIVISGRFVSSWNQMRQIQKPKLDIKITVDGKEVTIEELNKIVNNE